MTGFVFAMIVLAFVAIRALLNHWSADKRPEPPSRVVPQPPPAQSGLLARAFPQSKPAIQPWPTPFVPPAANLDSFPSAPPPRVFPVAPEVMPPAVVEEALEAAVEEMPDTRAQESTRLSDASTSERYIGSAALESTLDSTIESSLMGMPLGPITMAALPGAAAVSLPEQLEADVIALMDEGHEVAAVRLVCDEMDVGILESVRSVRRTAGLPTG